MHMSDALVSPQVALGVGTVAAVLIATAIKRVKPYINEQLPLMGVLGAFVFAAQMINFTIPGTGSSGHITGGILLASLLGPWAAFLVLCSVLIIQCFLFADGGILALGCNMVNMAAISCLMAYPMIFSPFNRGSHNTIGRITLLSILTCLVSGVLGAVMVTIETEFSGITALPTAEFLSFMLPIHVVIGLMEGVATAAVLGMIMKSRPDLLDNTNHNHNTIIPLTLLTLTSLLVAGVLSLLASSSPDGLEWSIMNVTRGEEVVATGVLHNMADTVQQTTALLPDYNTSWAGIVGSLLLIVCALIVTYMLRRRPQSRSQSCHPHAEPHSSHEKE